MREKYFAECSNDGSVLNFQQRSLFVSHYIVVCTEFAVALADWDIPETAVSDRY